MSILLIRTILQLISLKWPAGGRSAMRVEVVRIHPRICLVVNARIWMTIVSVL